MYYWCQCIYDQAFSRKGNALDIIFWDACCLTLGVRYPKVLRRFPYSSSALYLDRRPQNAQYQSLMIFLHFGVYCYYYYYYYLLIYLITSLLTVSELSLGGGSSYTSTNKTNKNKFT
jgi:hypothetical protein